MSYALRKNTDCADAGCKAKHYFGYVSHSRPLPCGACTPPGELLGVEPTGVTFVPKKRRKRCVAN